MYGVQSSSSRLPAHEHCAKGRPVFPVRRTQCERVRLFARESSVLVSLKTACWGSILRKLYTRSGSRFSARRNVQSTRTMPRQSRRLNRKARQLPVLQRLDRPIPKASNCHLRRRYYRNGRGELLACRKLPRVGPARAAVRCEAGRWEPTWSEPRSGGVKPKDIVVPSLASDSFIGR